MKSESGPDCRCKHTSLHQARAEPSTGPAWLLRKWPPQFHVNESLSPKTNHFQTTRWLLG